MKSTKTLFAILTIGSALLVSSLAPAQEKKDEKPAVPPVKPANVIPDRTAALAKYLGLSEDQKAKIKPLLDEEMTQTRALREDRTLTPQARIAKSREIREATSTKVKPLLNPDQLEKWQKMRPRPPAPGSPANPAAPAPAPAPGAAPTPPK
jgi:hypothetical protein